jgi:methionyl-tRNA formyltransferase
LNVPTQKALNIVFIGCVRFSGTVLRQLIKSPSANIVGIVTKGSSSFNADFASLENIATQAKIPCLSLEKFDPDEMAAWIAARNPQVLFCIGWSHLLGKQILNLAPLGVIGYHPAFLPLNRGRHPFIWALALGLMKTGFTFLQRQIIPKLGINHFNDPKRVGPEPKGAKLHLME